MPATAKSGGGPSPWSLKKTIQYDNRKNYLPSKQMAGANSGRDQLPQSSSPSPHLRLSESSAAQLKKSSKPQELHLTLHEVVLSSAVEDSRPI
jgi:hypothetical protein